MYRYVKDPAPGADNEHVIQRIEDGAFIPADEGNRDWQAYQTWLSAGNTPEPAA